MSKKNNVQYKMFYNSQEIFSKDFEEKPLEKIKTYQFFFSIDGENLEISDVSLEPKNNFFNLIIEIEENRELNLLESFNLKETKRVLNDLFDWETQSLLRLFYFDKKIEEMTDEYHLSELFNSFFPVTLNMNFWKQNDDLKNLIIKEVRETNSLDIQNLENHIFAISSIFKKNYAYDIELINFFSKDLLILFFQRVSQYWKNTNWTLTSNHRIINILSYSRDFIEVRDRRKPKTKNKKQLMKNLRFNFSFDPYKEKFIDYLDSKYKIWEQINLIYEQTYTRHNFWIKIIKLIHSYHSDQDSFLNEK